MTAMATGTKMNGNRSGTGPAASTAAVSVTINGATQSAIQGERLVDLINRSGIKLAQVCYHPQLGPVQTCDTCMVEIDGRLVRAWATAVAGGMKVSKTS